MATTAHRRRLEPSTTAFGGAPTSSPLDVAANAAPSLAGMARDISQVNRSAFEAVLAEFIEDYHQARPHQGLAQGPPDEPVDVVAAAAGAHLPTPMKQPPL